MMPSSARGACVVSPVFGPDVALARAPRELASGDVSWMGDSHVHLVVAATNDTDLEVWRNDGCTGLTSRALQRCASQDWRESFGLHASIRDPHERLRPLKSASTVTRSSVRLDPSARPTAGYGFVDLPARCRQHGSVGLLASLGARLGPPGSIRTIDCVSPHDSIDIDRFGREPDVKSLSSYASALPGAEESP